MFSVCYLPSWGAPNSRRRRRQLHCLGISPRLKTEDSYGISVVPHCRRHIHIRRTLGPVP